MSFTPAQQHQMYSNTPDVILLDVLRVLAPWDDDILTLHQHLLSFPSLSLEQLRLAFEGIYNARIEGVPAGLPTAQFRAEEKNRACRLVIMALVYGMLNLKRESVETCLSQLVIPCFQWALFPANCLPYRAVALYSAYTETMSTLRNTFDKNIDARKNPLTLEWMANIASVLVNDRLSKVFFDYGARLIYNPGQPLTTAPPEPSHVEDVVVDDDAVQFLAMIVLGSNSSYRLREGHEQCNYLCLEQLNKSLHVVSCGGTQSHWIRSRAAWEQEATEQASRVQQLDIAQADPTLLATGWHDGTVAFDLRDVPEPLARAALCRYFALRAVSVVSNNKDDTEYLRVTRSIHPIPYQEIALHKRLQSDYIDAQTMTNHVLQQFLDNPGLGLLMNRLIFDDNRICQHTLNIYMYMATQSYYSTLEPQAIDPKFSGNDKQNIVTVVTNAVRQEIEHHAQREAAGVTEGFTARFIEAKTVFLQPRDAEIVVQRPDLSPANTLDRLTQEMEQVYV